MVTWCMIQVVRTGPGTPKEKYLSTHTETIISESNRESSYPFPYTDCILCRFPKPYRSSHCRECRKCHLKMDHRCPWVNNCIGFYNYKYFYLFMFYVTIFGYFVAIVLLVEGIEFLGLQTHQNTAYPYIFLGYSGFTFLVISSPTFILFYHTYLMLYNKTTIENIREGDESCYNWCLHRYSSIPLIYDVKDYNLGYRLNFIQVMGSNPLLWPIPIYSSQGDGFVFPKRSSFEEQIAINKRDPC